MRQEFASHLDALLAGGAEPARPSTRAWLRGAPPVARPAARAARLQPDQGGERADRKAAGASPSRCRPHNCASSGGAAGAPLDAPIPQLFTVDGYSSVFLREQPQLVGSGARRRLGSRPGVSPAESGDEQALNLARTVGDLYFEDYIRAWDGLWNDIEIAPAFRISSSRPIWSGDGAAEFADEGRACSHRPADDVERCGAGRRQGGTAVGGIEKTIGRLLGSTGEAPAQPVIEDPAVKVDRHFAAMHKLMHAEGQDAPPIDRVLAALGDLAAYLRRVEISPGQDRRRRLPEVREVFSQVRCRSRLPRPCPLRGMLQSLAQTSAGLAQQKVGGEAAKRLNAVFTARQWRRSAAAPSPGAIPSSGTAVTTWHSPTSDASSDRAVRSTSSSRTNFIQPLADTSARPWRWNKLDGAATSACRQARSPSSNVQHASGRRSSEAAASRRSASNWSHYRSISAQAR